MKLITFGNENSPLAKVNPLLVAAGAAALVGGTAGAFMFMKSRERDALKKKIVRLNASRPTVGRRVVAPFLGAR